MFYFLGGLVLPKPLVATAEPPIATADVFVVGGEGGDVIGDESGTRDIGQER